MMNKLKHYQKYQIWYESAFVVFFFCVNAAILATSKIMEDSRTSGLPYDSWQPFVNEYSSAICLIVLMPFLGWLLNTLPLRWQQPKRTIGYYFVGSLVFSGLHIAGMVFIREVVYWTQSIDYNLGNLSYELIYEYRKDLWAYIFLLLFIAGYRFSLSRLLGEANLVAYGEDESSNQGCDRLLVKKLGKEFIVKVEDIEWLESSGNYVNLHINGRVYPARATLKGLVEQIKNKGFCRIHRSHAINLDEVDSITPLASGDSEVKLKNGKVLSLSRNYKDEFKFQLAS